jgi:hypothetical protein
VFLIIGQFKNFILDIFILKKMDKIFENQIIYLFCLISPLHMSSEEN